MSICDAAGQNQMFISLFFCIESSWYKKLISCWFEVIFCIYFYSSDLLCPGQTGQSSSPSEAWIIYFHPEQITSLSQRRLGQTTTHSRLKSHFQHLNEGRKLLILDKTIKTLHTNICTAETWIKDHVSLSIVNSLPPSSIFDISKSIHFTADIKFLFQLTCFA